MVHPLQETVRSAAQSRKVQSESVVPYWSDAACVLLALYLVPNLSILCLFGNSGEFFRGWLNVELALAFLLLLTIRPARLAFGLVALESVADLVGPVAHVFYFESAQAVEAFRFLGVIPGIRLALYATALLAYVCLLLLTFRLLARRIAYRTASAVLILAIVLITIVTQSVAGRYAFLFHQDVQSNHTLLIRTPLASIARTLYVRRHTAGKPQTIKSGLAHLLPTPGARNVPARRNVVTVLVESWGLVKDPVLRSSLIAPLTSPEIAARYNIEIGTVPFVGSTILGESRTLCGEIFAQPMAEVSAARLGQCYSAQFAQQGYSTLAINGISPRMYDRDRWMPKAGFQEQLFAPQLKRMGLRTCSGGLPGTCDDDIAELIHARLLHPPDARPQLIHWISLDSHLPVDVTPEAVQRAHCDGSLQREETALCVWSSLVRKANADIANLVLDRAIPPTIYHIAGDHAPPFYSTSKRARFSQTEVPFIILVPRS